MILDVKQTQAFQSNEFEILQNGNVVYRAGATWFPRKMRDEENRVVLTAQDGAMLLQAQYNPAGRVFDLPGQHPTTGKQKIGAYQVTDASANPVAVFYTPEGWSDSICLCLTFGNRIVYGYQRCMGLLEVVSFYENGMQIGQLTHSRRVVNHLDRYYLHFLPACDDLQPLMALYAVFYDSVFHNHDGKTITGETTDPYDSRSVYNDTYRPDFIRTCFGEQEAQRMDALVPQKINEPKNQKFIMKRLIYKLIPPVLLVIIFLLLFGIGFFL